MANKQTILIREMPLYISNQWTKHLNENGIVMKSIDRLMVVILDASKHILVSDFVILLKSGKLNMKVEKNYESEFKKLEDSLLNELSNSQYYI
jgi:hypothetical protein